MFINSSYINIFKYDVILINIYIYIYIYIYIIFHVLQKALGNTKEIV